MKLKSLVVVGMVIAFSVLLSLPPAFAQEPGMTFVSDVTIPDDTVFQPGETFTKTWKLKNTGGTDWLGYSLQFASGDQMDGVPDQVASVKTGGVADVSVAFTAPDTDGTYTSWWRLIDQNGISVGSQFYTRVVVGTGESAAPSEAATIEDLIARVGALHNMNETFTLGNIEFRPYDVFRQEDIWGALCGPCVVNDGVWAIARFNVTNHTGYSAMIVDHVKIYMMDDELNVYDSSYTPSRIPRKALVSAGALFGNDVGTVWSTMGVGYVDAAMIHIEPVPNNTDVLYLVFEDRKTGDLAFVRLQHLMSKSEMRYEGDFGNAPERED